MKNITIKINITLRKFILFAILLSVSIFAYCSRANIGDIILNGDYLRWDESNYDKRVWGE